MADVETRLAAIEALLEKIVELLEEQNVMLSEPPAEDDDDPPREPWEG